MKIRVDIRQRSHSVSSTSRFSSSLEQQVVGKSRFTFIDPARSTGWYGASVGDDRYIRNTKGSDLEKVSPVRVELSVGFWRARLAIPQAARWSKVVSVRPWLWWRRLNIPISKYFYDSLRHGARRRVPKYAGGFYLSQAPRSRLR